MQIVPPPRFCHIGTKMSILWPSKYAKIRFRPGLCPDPAGGAHDAPPDPLVGWKPLLIPHPTRHGPTFGARHASPKKSNQIYAYVSTALATATTRGSDLQKNSREQDRGDTTKISDVQKPNLLLQNKHWIQLEMPCGQPLCHHELDHFRVTRQDIFECS